MIQKLKLAALITAVFVFASCNNESSIKAGDKHDTTTYQSSNSSGTMSKMDNNSMSKSLMASMNSMMERMKSIKMTGDFDIDFANMMLEHHQGAIDMSEQELSSGNDEKLKAIAQNIIVAQKQEIAEFRDFVKTHKPSGMNHGEGDLNKSMSGMEGKMKNMQISGDMDKDFATMMIPHHEGAVAMAKTEIANGKSNELKQIAQNEINDQTKQIKEFKDWLENKK